METVGHPNGPIALSRLSVLNIGVTTGSKFAIYDDVCFEPVDVVHVYRA